MSTYLEHNQKEYLKFVINYLSHDEIIHATRFILHHSSEGSEREKIDGDLCQNKSTHTWTDDLFYAGVWVKIDRDYNPTHTIGFKLALGLSLWSDILYSKIHDEMLSDSLTDDDQKDIMKTILESSHDLDPLILSIT